MNHLRLEKTNRIFYAIYFMVFFAQAFSYCLLVTFLTNLGYSPTERGVFFMAEAVFGMINSVISGYLCDRYRRIKPFFYFSLVVYTIATWLLFKDTEISFLKHLILVMLLGGSLVVSNGLIDSLTLQTGADCRENFGAIRACGSVGWAICAPLCAWIVERWGYAALGPCFAGATLVLILLTMRVKDIRSSINRARINLGDVRSLFKNHRYALITLILFMFFLVDYTQNYGVVDKMNFLGGTEKHLGYYWALSAMLELPLFFYGNRLAHRFGSMKMLALSGFLYTLRYYLYGRVTSLTGVFAGGIMQSVTYPMLTVLSKTLIDDETADHLKTSGQQVASSIYNGFSTLICPIMIGLLEDNLGINNALYFIAMIALSATIITFFAGKEKK